MISLKCKNCGGEMSVDGSGNLYCEYCGTKSAFRDDELLAYKNFRLQVLNYLRGLHDQKADGNSHEELLWANAETAFFQTKDGNDVTIRYLYSFEEKDATVYLARNSVLYVYPAKKRDMAAAQLAGLERLSYPPADVKNLQECFPKFLGRYELEDGGVLLSFERPDNLFPLSMFGSLAPEHAAWITSRMENICCVLEYGKIMHGGINANAVFINPFTHHAVLFGDWKTARVGFVRDSDGVRDNLRDLRKLALRIMGTHASEAPKEFLAFLQSDPARDAFQDFERWDKVIEEGFGGRRFAKMQVDFE
ncbi:MAG: hypothetical protein J5546_04195 [Lachnospiraceae bacterium]|nr:hypothetical protein [Lachnospiraceae bacterium]